MRWDTSRVQPFWGYNLARTGEEACDEMHDMIDQLGEYTCMITVTSAFSEHVGMVLVGGSILLPSLPWTRLVILIGQKTFQHFFVTDNPHTHVNETESFSQP